MNLSQRLTFEPLRTLAAASVTGTYTAIGSALQNPTRILYIGNLTDATLLFSVDGVHDHVELPTSGFILLDAAANQTHNQGAFFPAGMTVYVKESGTPTTGSANVSTVYATAALNA